MLRRHSSIQLSSIEAVCGIKSNAMSFSERVLNGSHVMSESIDSLSFLIHYRIVRLIVIGKLIPLASNFILSSTDRKYGAYSPVSIASVSRVDLIISVAG